MTYQQFIEKIKRVAPTLRETEIKIMLEAAQRTFCDDTHILDGQWTFNTESGRMYYPIDEQCVAITQADRGTQLMLRHVGGIDSIIIQN